MEKVKEDACVLGMVINGRNEGREGGIRSSECNGIGR